MSKKMAASKFALALAGLLVVAGTNSAMAATGKITITNQTSVAKSRVASSGAVLNPPTTILSNSSGVINTGTFDPIYGGVGSITYRSGTIGTLAGTNGCAFSWNVLKTSWGTCTVTINAQSSGSTPASCSASVQTSDNSCNFTAVGSIR
jgi:hypothetical protein